MQESTEAEGLTRAQTSLRPAASTAVQPNRPGVWMKLAPFPEPTWEMDGAVSNGKLYLFAGITNAYGGLASWTPNRLVYEYDPATDRWTKKKPMPLPLHHIALAEYQDRIYCFGGFKPPESGPDAWVPIDNAWAYHPGDDTWSAIAPLPAKRGAASAAVVNGKIYVAGGACHPKGTGAATLPLAPHVSTGRVDEYDPATNTYRQKAPMLTARNHHMLEMVNNKLYAIGGRVGSSNIWFANKIDLVEEYDPALDTWVPAKARMPVPRSSMTAAAHNGLIYVAGGEGVSSVEAYDPATDKWMPVAEMQVPRMGTAGAILGDRFHIVSGHVRTANGSEAVADHDALQLTQ